MYKDIISYELAASVTEAHMLDIAARVASDWMRKQPGFIKWEIHTNKDGGYTDIVYWESREAAQNAEKDMANIPNAGDWFACYKEGTISSKNISQVGAF